MLSAKVVHTCISSLVCSTEDVIKQSLCLLYSLFLPFLMPCLPFCLLTSKGFLLGICDCAGGLLKIIAFPAVQTNKSINYSPGAHKQRERSHVLRAHVALKEGLNLVSELISSGGSQVELRLQVVGPSLQASVDPILYMHNMNNTCAYTQC